MQLINLHNIPAQRFNIVLDGLNCTIKLYQRGQRLYMDLETTDKVVFSGAVCLHVAMINQSPDPDFTGSLHFIDIKGRQAPQYDGLNSRWYLVYFSEGEL